jgi:hypothetical protein
LHLRSLVVLALAATYAAGIAAQQESSSAAKVCPEGPSAYLGRTIENVRVTSPFDFIHAVRKLEDQAAETLPPALKAGHPFDAKAYSDVTSELRIYIRTRLPSGLVAFRFVAVTPFL